MLRSLVDVHRLPCVLCDAPICTSSPHLAPLLLMDEFSTSLMLIRIMYSSHNIHYAVRMLLLGDHHLHI